MRGVFLFFSLISTILIVSCQKEISGFVQEENNSDSTLIRQITIMDTTGRYAGDTGTKILFFYDTRKRIKHVTSIIFSFTPSPTGLLEYEYRYNGNDTLPSAMMVKNWFDPTLYNSSPNTVDTIYFFYHEKEIIKDSLIRHYDNYSSSVVEYSKITPQKIKISKREVARNGGAILSRSTGNVYVTTVNGNQIEFRDTTLLITGHQIIRQFNVTYDNFVNSLKRIALKYPFTVPEEVTEYFPSQIPNFLMTNSVGNRLQKSFNYNGGPVTINRLQYDYNSQQLQVRRRDSADIRVWVYQYGF